MPNIELLEKSMPVAPIRIAALEGCRDLAEEVDRKLVKFRKEKSCWNAIYNGAQCLAVGLSPGSYCKFFSKC